MGVTVLLVSLIALVIIGVPLCFSMGASSLIYFLVMKPSLTEAVASKSMGRLL